MLQPGEDVLAHQLQNAPTTRGTHSSGPSMGGLGSKASVSHQIYRKECVESRKPVGIEDGNREWMGLKE